MLKQAKIEAVIEELARLQGHELNAVDMLEIRCRVACTLAAKERHRQRMAAPEYRWCKPRPAREKYFQAGKRITNDDAVDQPQQTDITAGQ